MQAQSGDAEAFTRLVAWRGPAIYRLCLTILRSAEDAEDAAQETFVIAWRELPRLRRPGAWPDWVRQIAVRRAIEVDRQRRRHRRQIEPVSVVPDGSAVSVDHVMLEAAFSSISVDDRAILALRYYADLDVPRVAVALGIPLGTAKSRLHRALERLKVVVVSAGDVDQC